MTLGTHHCRWGFPPEKLTLPEGEVHVWRSTLALSRPYLQRLGRTLKPEERLRAGRYRYQKDRDCFAASRGLLRAILGRYLDKDPSHLRFRYTAHGKPELESLDGQETVRFNLSHARDLLLVAVNRHRRLGIDLEYIRPEVLEDNIAERFFSSQEVSALGTVPEQFRVRAFYACWTRKEAFIKAVGEGLSIPLDQFTVSLEPGEPATLVSARVAQDEVYSWTLQELHPGTGYAGALCVEGNDWQTKCFQLPEHEPV